MTEFYGGFMSFNPVFPTVFNTISTQTNNQESDSNSNNPKLLTLKLSISKLQK